MSLNRRVFTQTIAAVGVTAAAPAMAAATIEVTMKNNPKAIFVPARFSHASFTLRSRSNSKRIGFAALPQPIWGAAGHTSGTLNKLISSAVAATLFSRALASGA